MPQRDDRLTNILDAGVPPEGPANPGVPRGYVCETCPAIQSALARIEENQRGSVERWARIEKQFDKVDAHLATTNGVLAVESKLLTQLEERATRDAVGAATKRAFGMIVIAMFLREGVKRVFGW